MSTSHRFRKGILPCRCEGSVQDIADGETKIVIHINASGQECGRELDAAYRAPASGGADGSSQGGGRGALVPVVADTGEHAEDSSDICMDVVAGPNGLADNGMFWSLKLRETK